MKNFVFDLYGTLADIHTDENSGKFIKSMQKYFCLPDFTERYKALCRELESGEELCEIDLFAVFKRLAPQNPQAAADYFRARSRSKLKAYKGVRALLKGLKARGAKLYILSNAQACFTLKELEKLKLKGFFSGIELSSEFGSKKPSSQFFGHIIKKYSLDINQTVYIGNDFESDIIGAKSAGLKAAYIKSNCSPQTDGLERVAAFADFATDSFAELSKYLLSL